MNAKVVRTAADQANDLIDNRELPNGGARVVDRIEPSFGEIDSSDDAFPQMIMNRLHLRYPTPMRRAMKQLLNAEDQAVAVEVREEHPLTQSVAKAVV